MTAAGGFPCGKQPTFSMGTILDQDNKATKSENV